MTPDNIQEYIELFPEIIIFLYPGYILIYTYLFMQAKTINDSKQILIKSIVLSFICVKISELQFINYFINNNAIKKNIALIIIALFISYLSYRIVNSQCVLCLYRKIRINTTYFGSDIEALLNNDKGMWIRVYLRDNKYMYEGSLGYKDLDSNSIRYIQLTGYKKYKIDKKGYFCKPILNYEGNINEVVTIRYNDILTVERRDNS